MFFFNFKKSNLSQVASNLIHQIQHTNGHLPHSKARFLYKAKNPLPPPTPRPLNHLNLDIYFYEDFPKISSDSYPASTRGANAFGRTSRHQH